MSWKGFQKSVIRAPQSVKQRFNVGEITKDPVYVDAERRFADMEKETTKLHDESKKYFDAINSMLSHQMEFSKACRAIYEPISGQVSDPNYAEDEGNQEGIKACEEYEAIVKELQETLAPELEMIDTRVIRPALEMMEIIKEIRKTAIKRDHKQLDYDRHRASLKKLQDKKERNLKDEKAMYKAESEVEQATQEYEYFNDLLKDELPKLFHLEREFIRPLFQSFYYMQLNIFYTLHERMQSIDIGYFNLQLDIEDAFQMKRGDIQERAEKLVIVHYKTKGLGRKPGSKYGNRPAIEGGSKPLAIEDGPPSPTGSPGPESAPPPYSPASNGVTSPTPSGSLGAAAASKPKPPPPKPKPSRFSNAPAAETCTALYDFEAQADGDLSFSAGETIEIVQRTSNENEWWTGKLRGKEGQFPGNYVQVNS